MASGSSLFFDAKDYDLLRVVNRFLERDLTAPHENTPRLLHPSLHPHGIKEMAISQETRVAYAVINLLDTLEVGLVTERIKTLRTLHDEVLYSGTSSFRYNTGRVLIQIMKNLIRSHGNLDAQLRLAHDFRRAASGKRRIIRNMLRRYHLLEMPEEWNQVAFDNHVHDAHTKGRKSATHLIMDAWIKGIRNLDVVYYNFVEEAAIKELLQAADIMGIKVRIGIEFQARFRDRYVQFVWQPRGFHDYREMLAFFNEKPTQHLMRMGREASLFHHEYVMELRERYNTRLRHELADLLGIMPEPISASDIVSMVGIGQTSRVHLAELIHRRVQEACGRYLHSHGTDEAAWTEEEKKARKEIVARVNEIVPDVIVDTWLSAAKNPDIVLPQYPNENQNTPEILRLLPATLIDWLTSIRMPCHIILNLSNLAVTDVLELVYECQGMISHLELFNLKNYLAGNMQGMAAISELQVAINEGSAVALKKIIRTLIRQQDELDTPEARERSRVCTEVLHNIQKLQSYYALSPLGIRIGSDSTSRSSRMHGMGFVFPQTLPPNAQKQLVTPGPHRQAMPIPISMEAYPRLTYYPKRHQPLAKILTSAIRSLLGFRYFGFKKEEDWLINPKTARYARQGDIYTLGGFQPQYFFSDGIPKSPPKGQGSPGFHYMNTTLKNTIKVVLGFSVTALTFAYTQSWWFLAWFGPVIWFAITGFRNIVQATLAGGGLKGSPLLRWNDYLSWSRLCDSLLYTGLSVPLLEYGVRWLLLEQIMGMNSVDNPTIFFTIISLINGFYIAGHNAYRGFPRAAIIGNIFRSFFAIPLSMAYSMLTLEIFFSLGWDGPQHLLILQQGGAVLSKLASDTVAAVIEGVADKVDYLHKRYWDYKSKLEQLLTSFARLEVLLPEEDVLEFLLRPKDFLHNEESETEDLEKTVIISSLDLLYFWMYQPRARSTLRRIMADMTQEERLIFTHSQLVLTRVHEVSQLFVDGLMGPNFARPLAFYLEKHEQYLSDLVRMTGIPFYQKP